MRFSCFYIYIISMNAEQLILTFYMNYVWCSRSRECLKFLIKAEESKMKWVEVITKLRYYDTWHQTTLVTKDTHVCVHTYRDACRVGDRVLFFKIDSWSQPSCVQFLYFLSVEIDTKGMNMEVVLNLWLFFSYKFSSIFQQLPLILLYLKSQSYVPPLDVEINIILTVIGQWRAEFKSKGLSQNIRAGLAAGVRGW